MRQKETMPAIGECNCSHAWTGKDEYKMFEGYAYMPPRLHSEFRLLETGIARPGKLDFATWNLLEIKGAVRVLS